MSSQVTPITPSGLPLQHPLPEHCVPACWRAVCWGAIAAGTSAAMALQVLFMMLGAGLGFAIYSPLTEANPIADLGAGAILIQGVSAVLSLWFGGWVAGRFSPIGLRSSGWLHGFSVWCAATVAGVLFVSAGAGWALGDLSKLVGGGLSLAGQPVSAVAGSVAETAKDALKQSTDTIASFTDEAVDGRSADAPRSGAIRARREVGMAVARLFNPLQEAGVTDNRAAVVKALVDTTGMSPTDAERTVAGWTTTYDRLKAELTAAKDAAEAKAREAADKASKALALFSLAAFVGFLLGAIAASHGGTHGVECARREEIRGDPVQG